MWPFKWSCIVTNFLRIKPTICTNFSNLFWNGNLHVSNSSSVHHQVLFTVHSAMVYVIQVCRQLASRIRMEYALISQIYFWNEILHVSDSSSVHHPEFFTVHTAMVYVIQVCRQLASRIRMEHALISQIYFWNEILHVSDSSSVHHPKFFTVHIAMVYVIQVCRQLASRIRMEHDDGQRNCPKHVEFRSKNKFEKLVHLVGFIIGTQNFTASLRLYFNIPVS
jgi:hypothetical protein